MREKSAKRALSAENGAPCRGQSAALRSDCAAFCENFSVMKRFIVVKSTLNRPCSARRDDARSDLHGTALDRRFTGYCTSLALFPQRIDKLIDEAFVFRGQAGGVDLAAAVYAEKVVGRYMKYSGNMDQYVVGRIAQRILISTNHAFRQVKARRQHFLRPTPFNAQFANPIAESHRIETFHTVFFAKETSY